MIFFLLSGSISASAEPGREFRPRAPGFDLKQKKLLTPTLTSEQREQHLGIVRGQWTSWSGRGSKLERVIGAEQQHELTAARMEAVARLTDLDPKHELLSAAEWTEVRERYQQSMKQIENKAEDIEFVHEDAGARTAQITRYEELARGRLARTLSTALAHEQPSPERLQKITRELSEKHPFLGSPFKVEMLIADMRKIHPTLAKWDFRELDDGRKFRGDRMLPPSTQAAVTAVGHRAFAGANVLFANHMYSDSLSMVDALTALGLDTDNARFVATPYPFDKRVRLSLEHRGVKVAEAPYSVEETKKLVGEAVEALLAKARSNHGPIVVFDDGGMATQYIAEHHKEELYRFRIVEITKAGERVGKTVLPRALGVQVADHGYVGGANRAALRDRFIEIRTLDEGSRTAAARAWDEQSGRGHNPYMTTRNPEHQLPASSFGFAYYTYSNTAYKRDVMTPLYTEQVNASLFSAIERGGHPIANKRVAIVGGGAMGIAAARELRTSGYEVTFVEPDAERVKVLAGEQFAVAPLRDALPGRGIVLEMSGMKNVIGLDELSLIDNGAFLAHGSSKDNPFDMTAIKAMAKSRVD